MSTYESSSSPLESAAGVAGPETTAAFKALANETRLAILLGLWEAYEPFAAEEPVAFSVLRERVGVRDKGRFNYHLRELTGRFIRQTDQGYELRRAGHQLVRTVIAGTGLTDVSLEPTVVSQPCYLCGGETVVSYEDEWLFWSCTECEGLFSREHVPTGALAIAGFDPAGLADRSPEEVLNAAWTGGDYPTSLGGVCDACSGPMEGWLHRCQDHETGESVCMTCGWREETVARFRCPVCKRNFQVVPWWLVLAHPAVVSFYYEHGIPLQFEDSVDFQPRIESSLQPELDQELVSEAPLRVRVTVQHDGDELQVTLDEDLDVVDVCT